MSKSKPTRETASRDHSLDDGEILERFIAKSEREYARAGGSFNLPSRSSSYVEGAELQVCNALGSYRVPFVEKDGHVRFGEEIPDDMETLEAFHVESLESFDRNRQALACLKPTNHVEAKEKERVLAELDEARELMVTSHERVRELVRGVSPSGGDAA